MGVGDKNWQKFPPIILFALGALVQKVPHVHNGVHERFQKIGYPMPHSRCFQLVVLLVGLMPCVMAETAPVPPGQGVGGPGGERSEPRGGVRLLPARSREVEIVVLRFTDAVPDAKGVESLAMRSAEGYNITNVVSQGDVQVIYLERLFDPAAKFPLRLPDRLSSDAERAQAILKAVSDAAAARASAGLGR